MEGRSLYAEPHPEYGDLQLVVVGRFSSQSIDTNANVRRILREHDVQLYVEDNLPELIDEIRRTGKVLQPENEQG